MPTRSRRLAAMLVKYALRPALKVVAIFALLVVTLIVVGAFKARRMPDFGTWHTTALQAEFRARDDAQGDLTLADYLETEAALFEELGTEVLAGVEPLAELTLSRFSSHGTNNPVRFPTNWNRTFELTPNDVKGGALLLHGLTDSPFSLLEVAETLADEGYYVLALRLPGHGTAPAGLASIRWRDWMAAARLGARHVDQHVGERGPFLVVGYSNGGGLAVKYALEAVEDPDLPVPDRLVLFSPCIGITRFAVVSGWHRLLSWIPYFEKSAWMSIEPEIDPYKYNSFPKNAGYQTHLLTGEVQAHFNRLKRAGRASEFPPALTFQSLVDTTVLTEAIANGLYAGLERDGNELVLFDVNRVAVFRYLFTSDQRELLESLEGNRELPYTLTVVTNVDAETLDVMARTTTPRTNEPLLTRLDLEWPGGVYSLSHVALPFSPGNWLYGLEQPLEMDYGFNLGSIAPRGERNLLRLSANQFLRLRYNPFFEYVERRVRETVAVGPPAPSTP
ncbi:MAG: alpha/beta hydrolase [Planctomycetota bacterium]|jgi:alpha-beta hydrolase superfamily lysophospholipase